MRGGWSSAGSLTLVHMVALLTLTNAPASGQAASGVLEPGARVRVTAATAGRFTGLYIRGTPDSMWVARSAGLGVDTLGFARDAIARLERSVGSRSNIGQGAKVGALVGVGAGSFWVPLPAPRPKVTSSRSIPRPARWAVASSWARPGRSWDSSSVG